MAETPNRTWENRPSRDYRGASGNAAMVEMGTRPAIERARTVTLHLQLARRSSIPTNPRLANLPLNGFSYSNSLFSFKVVLGWRSGGGP